MRKPPGNGYNMPTYPLKLDMLSARYSFPSNQAGVGGYWETHQTLPAAGMPSFAGEQSPVPAPHGGRTTALPSPPPGGHHQGSTIPQPSQQAARSHRYLLHPPRALGQPGREGSITHVVPLVSPKRW